MKPKYRLQRMTPQELEIRGGCGGCAFGNRPGAACNERMRVKICSPAGAKYLQVFKEVTPSTS